MGSVDIIPGISGGTIAFITGIYYDLLKSIDRFSLKKLVRGQFKLFWSDINGPFLVSLSLGIASGIFFLSAIIVYLFAHHPISTNSFLFGIILGTFFQFIRLIKNKKIDDYIFFLMSLISSIALARLNSFDIEPTPVYLFFCSAFAASAMILPGISGAMIFLILGVYNEVLFVVQNSIKVLFNFSVENFLNIYSKVFSVLLGIIFGLKIFSKFLVWLFNYRKRKTFLILTGLVGGSLPKLWPLKNHLNLDTLNSLFTSKECLMMFKASEVSESGFFIFAGLILILAFNGLQKPIEYF